MNAPNAARRVPALAATLALAATAALAQKAGQNGNGQGGNAPAPTIDAATGNTLNKAIELLNTDKFAEAAAAIATLKLDKLSPYERSKVEQVLFQIAYSQEKYGEARTHLENAIEAGGLNDQEIATLKYQNAQLYMTESRWKEGAAALEEWFKTAQNPNSAAYYLLAAAYYQLEDMDRALPNAERAVALMERPQESWMQMLLGLYLLKERYKDARPLLQRLIELAPDKKLYWLQLSGVYTQLEDYSNALAIMQLAYGAELLTDDADIRRLADLLLFNEIPYRCAQVLEAGIERKTLKLDDKLYEKLANCWIAAGELDKALSPLERAAELSSTGDPYVRIAEVQVQNADWTAAQGALERGMAKGQLRDTAGAQSLMGIALFNQHKLAEARTWFERSQQSEKYRQTAKSYLQAIDSQLRPLRQ